MSPDLLMELRAIAMEYKIVIATARQKPSVPIFEVPMQIEHPIIFKVIKNRNK